MTTPDSTAHTNATRIPIIEESLVVDTRTDVTGKLRVRIEADDVVEHAELHSVHDEVQVERVDRDQPVEAPRAPWMEGDVLVVPVYEERLVLQRQWVLTQELRLVRQRHEQAGSTPVRLRRERAVVEREQADGSWVEVPAEVTAKGTVPPAQAAPVGHSGMDAMNPTGNAARQGGPGQAVPAVIAAKETP